MVNTRFGELGELQFNREGFGSEKRFEPDWANVVLLYSRFRAQSGRVLGGVQEATQ